MVNQDDMQKNPFLNDSQIREKAPSVFAEKPSSEVSKHYTHIPTTKVINDMRSLGWDVVDVQEVKARTKSTIGVQKHLVVFRNPDVVINGDDGDTVFPNGLVIADTQFEAVKMRHMGYTFEDLQVKIKEMVEKLPLTVESMNKMKSTELGQKQAVEFAKKALNTRFTKDEIKRVKIDLNELLIPVRNEDAGSDLWSIFNVVQEKIITGDFEYVAAGKVRKAREIKNFKQDQKINKELFDLALEYAS